MNRCPWCGDPVTADDIETIHEEYPDIFEQVDLLGEESLTELQQALYHAEIHADCYYNL